MRQRDLAPRDWATTQHNKGSTLLALSEVENNAAPLNEAVAAFELALSVRTASSAPRDWAATQNALANALVRLGIASQRVDLTERALNSFLAAREVFRREGMRHYAEVLDRQIAHVALGLAQVLREEGEEKKDAALLTKAIWAYRIAVKDYLREHDPQDWAAAQCALGNIFDGMARRSGSAAALGEAVAASAPP